VLHKATFAVDHRDGDVARSRRWGGFWGISEFGRQRLRDGVLSGLLTIYARDVVVALKPKRASIHVCRCSKFYQSIVNIEIGSEGSIVCMGDRL
jgi:hypothetical protein